ncbi:oxidoreductase [Arcanobacterium bovis]|uniref:Oxidoreductase n=1 Tax=Arcanobacterium bovis TaxID=2529275 RepID=A0A4Q9V2Y3_9ACTO|nr:oxidoreductase [Arcanobacterium bovis]TBW22822.1 oxidoreductase [Arcanobacterium bovis]
MGLFSRWTRSKLDVVDLGASPTRSQIHSAQEYFADFVATRSSVEAYFEEATPRESAALVLVAADGEWTRRKVTDAASARKIAQKLEIPLFDVAERGYPPQMREWNKKNPGSTRR